MEELSCSAIRRTKQKEEKIVTKINLKDEMIGEQISQDIL